MKNAGITLSSTPEKVEMFPEPYSNKISQSCEAKAMASAVSLTLSIAVNRLAVLNPQHELSPNSQIWPYKLGEHEIEPDASNYIMTKANDKKEMLLPEKQKNLPQNEDQKLTGVSHIDILSMTFDEGTLIEPKFKLLDD